MARITGAMVTFNDLNYMAFVSGEIIAKTSIPDSDECITYGQLGTYVNYDPLPFAGGYASNRLVPYHKIKQSIYALPLFIYVGYTQGATTSFTIHNAAEHPWVITSKPFWATCDPDSGSTTSTVVTVTAAAYIGSTARSGDIEFYSSASGATGSVTIQQAGNPGVPTDSILLYRGLTDVDRCSTSNQGVYWIPQGQTWSGGPTQLYSNENGTAQAPSGWYNDGGGRWRQWSGSGFVGSGIC